MTGFQFTNAYFSGRLVALYAQPNDATFINFSGIAAGISIDIYAIIFIYWENRHFCEWLFLKNKTTFQKIKN
jgi:hypothetical protein